MKSNTRNHLKRYAKILVTVDYPATISSDEAFDDWMRTLDKVISDKGVRPMYSALTSVHATDPSDDEQHGEIAHSLGDKSVRFIDREQEIVAAGPVVKFTERLPSAPYTQWVTTARQVLRYQDGQYETGRQVLDENGDHFEYQFTFPKGDDPFKAARAFAEGVNALTLYAETHPPEGFTTGHKDGHKPKEIAVIWVKGKRAAIARTYDVESMPRQGDFALQFENGVSEKGYALTVTLLYRDNYDRIRKMVERYYDDVQWLDAAQYDI